MGTRSPLVLPRDLTPSRMLGTSRRLQVDDDNPEPRPFWEKEGARKLLVLLLGIVLASLGALLLVRLVQTSSCYGQQLLSCPNTSFLLLPLWSGLPFLLIGIVLVAYSLRAE